MARVSNAVPNAILRCSVVEVGRAFEGRLEAIGTR